MKLKVKVEKAHFEINGQMQVSLNILEARRETSIFAF